VGEVVFADDSFYVDSEGVGWAKDFDDAAASGAARGGKVGDFDVDGEAFEAVFVVGVPGALLELGFFAEDSVRGGFWCGGDLHAIGDEDGLGHTLVERGDVVAVNHGEMVPCVGAAVGALVMEDADYGGIAAGENAEDSAGAAAVTASGSFVDDDFIALHGAVELVRWDEEIVVAVSAAVGTDEGVAVAVHVDTTGDEAVAGGAVFLGKIDCAAWGTGGFFGGCGGEAPLLVVELDEVPAGGDAG
jgi:hypothetical protein